MRLPFELPRLSVLLALLLCACTPAAEPVTQGPVVLAAASVEEAMAEVAEAWAAHGHAAPVLSFGGTPALARQVDGGAPADLILSADRQWIAWLDQRGHLAPQGRADLLGNRLVIASRRIPLHPLSLGELPGRLRPGERLALADPAVVPAGRYARAALESAGVWGQLQDRIAPADSVRAALALVERGEAPFAIVYASDLKAAPHLVRAGDVAQRHTPEIVYPLAMLAQSQHVDAPGFAAFLQSPEAAAIFARHGFIVPGE